MRRDPIPPGARRAGATSLRPIRVGVDLRCLETGELRGLGRYTLEIVRALSSRPSLELSGIARRTIPFEIPFGVHVLRSRREIIAEQVELAIQIRRLRFDVMFCPANRGLPLFSPCPTVLTLHDTAEWDSHLVAPSSGRSALRMNYASIASLASATSIITVSETSAMDIVGSLRIDKKVVEVIWEGAAARFRSCDERDCRRVLDQYGLTTGFILYVGGFGLKKNVETLIRARAGMGGDLPPLVLVGRLIEEADTLRDLSVRLGAVEVVKFIGAVDDDDLPRLYQAAGCFCSPALGEGFGLPVLEAMTAGTPVVAADAGSLPEIVGAGGQLFRPGDSAALATALTEILVHPACAARWGAAARTRAGDFSWATAGAHTEEVLRAAAMTPARRVWSGRLGSLRASRGRVHPKRPRQDIS